jgi:hypothetical protein
MKNNAPPQAFQFRKSSSSVWQFPVHGPTTFQAGSKYYLIWGTRSDAGPGWKLELILIVCLNSQPHHQHRRGTAITEHRSQQHSIMGKPTPTQSWAFPQLKPILDHLPDEDLLETISYAASLSGGGGRPLQGTFPPSFFPNGSS